MTPEFWNQRYQNSEYAYGIEPNRFFEEQIRRLAPGSILLPAEGEGRNAVFAAALGWEVTAFDSSSEGQKKALRLAKEHGVTIEYHVGTLEVVPLHKGPFDALGLIYAHFSAEFKSAYHAALGPMLKPNGIVLLEAFGQNHRRYVEADPRIGGPKDPEVLYSTEEIRRDFPDFEIDGLEEVEIELHEGIYHNGLGSVVRFVGRKKPKTNL